MSELKTMTVLEAYQLECNDNDLVYLKSEADKVIADLRAQIVQADAECANALKCLKVKDKELRHQKYKRCLAMAKQCKESLRLMRTYEVTKDYWNLEPGHDAEYFCKKGDFYSKWRKRWLELAEKFKPNKGVK